VTRFFSWTMSLAFRKTCEQPLACFWLRKGRRSIMPCSSACETSCGGARSQGPRWCMFLTGVRGVGLRDSVLPSIRHL
jgi:hypothetical protein